MRRRSAPLSDAQPSRRWSLLGAISIIASILLSAVVAVPAQAAGPKYPRVRAIAASADYLVYGQQTANAYGLFFPKGSKLYYVGTRGGRHLLADFDPEREQSLQGSTLVQADSYTVVSDAALPEQVRWQDLRSGRAGVFQLPASENLVGAAPGGWVAIRTEGSRSQLVRYTTAGRTTDLGRPLPNDTPLRVTIGPGGVVVAAGNTGSGQFDEQPNSSGLIRYANFRSPSRWRTIYSAGKGIDTSCNAPSTTHVVCYFEKYAAKHSGSVLLPLAGGRKNWLNDHPKTCPVLSLTTVGRTAVAKASGDSPKQHCFRGRLTQLAADGTATTPKRAWGAHSSYITAGLGGILLDSKDQRRIVRLSSVNGTARTIVTAR